jgi:hypothetical protein
MADTDITDLYDLYCSVKKTEAAQTDCQLLFQTDFRLNGINTGLTISGGSYAEGTSWHEAFVWHTDTYNQLDKAGALNSQLNLFSRCMWTRHCNKYISAQVVLSTILECKNETFERKYIIDEILADLKTA